MLTGRQAHLAEGDARTVRIDRGYGPFGAAADNSPEAQAARAALVPDAGELWLVESEPWPLPPGPRGVQRAPLVQVVDGGAAPPERERSAAMRGGKVAVGSGAYPAQTYHAKNNQT